MAKFRMRLNTKDFEADLRKAVARAPYTVEKFLRLKAQRVFTRSQNEVPVDKGFLKSTGKVLPVTRRRNRFRIEIVYDAPYALSVHENPRSGKTGGVSPRGARYRSWAEHGKWKYLEHPHMAEEQTLTRDAARFFAELWR